MLRINLYYKIRAGKNTMLLHCFRTREENCVIAKKFPTQFFIYNIEYK